MSADEADGEYLVIVDADRIHDYVFSPHQLKLIRGGSRILRDLSDKVLPKIARTISPAVDIVVAAGGKIIAIFPNSDEAKGFLKKTNETFRECTATATATRVPAPATPTDSRDWPVVD